MAKLADALEQAREQKLDLALVAFKESSDLVSLRSVWLLSITISLSFVDLVSLLLRLWPDSAEPSPAGLDNWPFLAQNEGEWSMSPRMAELLALDFRQREPETFRTAHRILIAREEALESEADPNETWFIRGRVSYYLAAIDSNESVRSFGEAFADPPAPDRTACRIWLTTLALHQAPLLHEHERALTFFRAFRHYVEGRRSQAHENFETVLAGDQEDVFAAISLHLSGNIERTRSPDRAMRRIEKSIVMSQKLSLIENEVMATHTLVWTLIERAHRRLDGAKEDLRTASSMARDNLKRAIKTDDRGLIVWCTRTAATAEWLSLTDNRRTLKRVTASRRKDLIEALRESSNQALTLGDIETAALATNDAASVLRDSGLQLEAATEISRFLDDVVWARIPHSALNRLGKTAGSIASLSSGDDAQAEAAEKLLKRLGEIQARRDFGRT